MTVGAVEDLQRSCRVYGALHHYPNTTGEIVAKVHQELGSELPGCYGSNIHRVPHSVDPAYPLDHLPNPHGVFRWVIAQGVIIDVIIHCIVDSPGAPLEGNGVGGLDLVRVTTYYYN